MDGVVDNRLGVPLSGRSALQIARRHLTVLLEALLQPAIPIKHDGADGGSGGKALRVESLCQGQMTLGQRWRVVLAHAMSRREETSEQADMGG